MEFLEAAFGHLAYQKHGDGPEVFLLFHGFGQNLKAYDTFIPLRKEEETYLVFDLFYHGQSSWESVNQKLTKEIWKAIIALLMQKEGFNRFHLIGYSMGGKFSLLTYELFPCHVKSLLLMAPDGIKTGLWYNMATFPGILNRLFKHVVFHPKRFFKTMDLLNSFGVLQGSITKFVKSQMQTRTMRAQVYFTWNVFKPLQPDLSSIIKMIRMNHTPITLLTGKYDMMVTTENLKKFSSKIIHLENIQLDCGHNALIEETASFLKSQS